MNKIFIYVWSIINGYNCLKHRFDVETDSEELVPRNLFSSTPQKSISCPLTIPGRRVGLSRLLNSPHFHETFGISLYIYTQKFFPSLHLYVGDEVTGEIFKESKYQTKSYRLEKWFWIVPRMVPWVSYDRTCYNESPDVWTSYCLWFNLTLVTTNQLLQVRFGDWSLVWNDLRKMHYFMTKIVSFYKSLGGLPHGTFCEKVIITVLRLHFGREGSTPSSEDSRDLVRTVKLDKGVICLTLSELD